MTEQPRAGGSYRRQKDGSLKPINVPAPEAEPAKPAKPAGSANPPAAKPEK